ncbi:hypothetical protein LW858_02660 [Bacillus cereus]|uniref:hypothetical protein n=1 Tax=Bacillus cereus TaxID=1396 RepID=UPI001F1AFE36|nr:hypothetical protein [Bacillus cereus]UIJ67216.1 hypothetical protein LW858_02660 [Bacillus cereus]
MEKPLAYPWSLRRAFVFFLCFILPPIGCIYLFMNRKVLDKKDFTLYLLFALTNLSLHIVVAFFTRDFWIITLHYIISMIIIIYSNIPEKSS